LDHSSLGIYMHGTSSMYGIASTRRFEQVKFKNRPNQMCCIKSAAMPRTRTVLSIADNACPMTP
jgi:hypothetical protein